MTVLLPKPQPSFTVVQPDRRPEQAWSDYWASLDAFVRDQQAGNFRPLLTGNRTYYVSNNSSGGLQGNDSNNGLTPGTPFLTVQHAIDTAYGKIDLNGFNVTIQVLDGTYTQALNVIAPQVGAGIITINGNAATPGNVTLSSSTVTVQVQRNGLISLSNLRIQTNGAVNSFCLVAQLSGILQFSGPLIFGTGGSGLGAHMFSTGFGTIDSQANNYTIEGSAGLHMLAQTNGYISNNGSAVTIPTARAFSTFAYSANLAFINAAATSNVLTGYTGAGFAGTTGNRYTVTVNGVVYVNGVPGNYLPGNANVAPTSGGQYL